MFHICLVALLLSPFAAIAQPIDRYILPDCERTPHIRTSNYPGFSSIVSSNNLTQPAGKAVAAQGQAVHLSARVFDRNCVPISEAKVELWQADPQGRHRFATPASLATPDPVFTGAGRATSDNLGQFQFVTLYPAPYSYRVKRDDDTYYRVRRAPHFNLRITHPDLRNFHTNLFFDGDHRNATDHRFKRLSAKNKPRVLMRVTPINGDANNGLQAFVDIILPDSAAFRKY